MLYEAVGRHFVCTPGAVYEINMDFPLMQLYHFSCLCSCVILIYHLSIFSAVVYFYERNR